MKTVFCIVSKNTFVRIYCMRTFCDLVNIPLIERLFTRYILELTVGLTLLIYLLLHIDDFYLFV
jgi:hypothetical protein